MKYFDLLSRLLGSILLLFTIGCGGGDGNSNKIVDDLPVVDPESFLIHERGSLEYYLKSIDYGVENDEQFKKPSSENIQIFDSTIQEILAKNYQHASVLAQSINYELVRYLDEQSTKQFYLLREKKSLPSNHRYGGGYYLFRPDANYNVAIHIPHPKADIETNNEGIDLYLQANVKYLLLAGSHRRSSPVASECQNINDYRESDSVHNIAHYFFRTHKVIEDFDRTVVSIELHGFGSSSLALLQSQCGTSNNKYLVNLSETGSDLSPGERSLMHSLRSIINSENIIQGCIYSDVLDAGSNDIYTKSLGGTLNTLARYTNQSNDVCNNPAPDELNSHRYLHIEQSFAVRSDKKALMISYIKQAIESFFSND